MARTKQTARRSIFAAPAPVSSSEDVDDEEDGQDKATEEGEDGDFAVEYEEDAVLSGSDSHTSRAHGQGEPKPNAPDNDFCNTIAADSGYQSGPRTDHDTLGENVAMDDDACSVATDGQHSSLPLEHKHVLEAQFARTLLDRIRPELRDRCIAQLEILPNLLRRFSILIRGRATSQKERDAASFVRHRRACISDHLRVEVTQEPRHATSTGLSLSQKMAMWGLDPAKGDTSSNHHPLSDSSSDEVEDLSTAVLLQYSDLREFLLESNEHAWLIHQLEITVEPEVVSSHWLQARDLVIDSFDHLSKRFRKSHSMTICLPWQPAKFLQQQYAHLDDLPSLGSVITISGEVDNAYATSCKEYVSRVWPRYGPLILTSLQRAASSSIRSLKHAASNLTIQIRLTDDSTIFDLSGTPLFLLDATEVLLWLSIACRASESSCRLSIGSMVLEKVGTGQLTFQAKPFFVDIWTDNHISRATCWHHLFRNPVIAKSYPIPHRAGHEKGLEASMDTMVTLASTDFAVVYAGFVMLKGISSLLAPTDKIGNSVTWHFLVTEVDKRQSYNDGLGYSRLRNLEDAMFDGARHFVGWSKDVDFYVGSENANYCNIGFSRESMTNSGLSLEAAVSITMGKFVNLGAKVVRGKKDMPESLVSRDFSETMDIATGFKVILSDVETSQHWLADGASTILHLCRAWLTGKYTRTAPKDPSIAASIWTPAASGGPQASYDILSSRDNRTLPLYPSVLAVKGKEPVGRSNVEPHNDDPTVEQEWLLLQDKIWRFYHWLELIHDRMDPARTPAEIELVRKGTNAIGFEFVELLRERELKPRTIGLQANARAWLDYSRKVNAIHIFGRNFGDLMMPAALSEQSLSEEPSSCFHDGAAPYGQDYLMAPLSVLRERLNTFTHTDTCAQIAHGLHWCNINQCFDMCKCRRLGKSGSSTRCKSLVISFHCKHSITCTSRTTKSTGVPEVFVKHPDAAIVVGTQLLTKTVPAKRTSSDGRVPSEDTISRRQLRSDSGYGSNQCSNVSQDSPAGDASAEISSREGYKIRGAANAGCKLRKRPKNK